MGNFVRDDLAARPAESLALIVLAADGTRTEWTFGELVSASSGAAAQLASHGVGQGDVVLCLVGNGIDYVLLLLACQHLGAVLLPCSEQLRSKDIALRVERARPTLIVSDPRNRAELEGRTVLWTPLSQTGDAPPFAEVGEIDPAFILFTSGTSGEPKMVTHAQRYVSGQRLQATHWMAAEAGELVWSTAAPGWSKSTRNGFLAPWFCDAVALLLDARFDPAERLAVIRREQVNVLCMAPTEYRLIAAAGAIGALPSVRRLITAGEALGAPTVDAWASQTGLIIADGYGQTETAHIAGVRPGETAPAGSMGRPLPGVSVEIRDGELVVDPSTVPTFFLGYDGSPAPSGWWRTGDQVRQDADGWLYFEARVDDVIVSAGYRIGPAEVESTLLGHPAVRECAVIGAPDEVRGEIVVAVVALRDGFEASDDLVRELQEFVKAETAPYKYPRQIRFVDALPKTTSGKVHRSALR